MKLSLKNHRVAAVRAGLTLIELVVVMVILAAVAGIVLPLLPSMVSRAHTSTGATNVGEVAKAIQTHEALYAAYPTNFDSLIDETGNIADYVPHGTDLVLYEPEAEELESLEHAGVVSLRPMSTAANAGGSFWSPTFFPYANADISHASNIIDIDDVEDLARLTNVAAARLGLSSDADVVYVVVGVGGYTSMQGKSLQEAPVHFGESQAETPATVYSRLGVVFQVTDAAGNALHNARLSQVVAFHDGGLTGINGHLAEYYEATAN